MKCPICGKPTTWKENPNRPFCSERCRIIDLAKWSTEDYRVASPLSDVDETVDQPQDDQE